MDDGQRRARGKHEDALSTRLNGCRSALLYAVARLLSVQWPWFPRASCKASLESQSQGRMESVTSQHTHGTHRTRGGNSPADERISSARACSKFSLWLCLSAR